MTIEYLKRGKSDAERGEDDAKTRAVVEATLKDIEARGDNSVRALSEKFDNYSPKNFKLSQGEIEALMARVTPREMADLKFAQDNVRRFAQAQRESMLDIEIEMRRPICRWQRHRSPVYRASSPAPRLSTGNRTRR